MSLWAVQGAGGGGGGGGGRFIQEEEEEGLLEGKDGRGGSAFKVQYSTHIYTERRCACFVTLHVHACLVHHTYTHTDRCRMYAHMHKDLATRTHTLTAANSLDPFQPNP